LLAVRQLPRYNSLVKRKNGSVPVFERLLTLLGLILIFFLLGGRDQKIYKPIPFPTLAPLPITPFPTAPSGALRAFDCYRESPYDASKDLLDVLDFVKKRYEEKGHKKDLIPFFNCVSISYEDLKKDKLFARFGYSYYEGDPYPIDMAIEIDNSFKGNDKTILSQLFVHELAHLGQLVRTVRSGEELNCIEREAEAWYEEAEFVAKYFTKEEYNNIMEKSNQAFSEKDSYVTRLLIDNYYLQQYVKEANIRCNKDDVCYKETLLQLIKNDEKTKLSCERRSNITDGY
jgi:hypothetical protein